MPEASTVLPLALACDVSMVSVVPSYCLQLAGAPDFAKYFPRDFVPGFYVIWQKGDQAPEGCSSKKRLTFPPGSFSW